MSQHVWGLYLCRCGIRVLPNSEKSELQALLADARVQVRLNPRAIRGVCHCLNFTAAPGVTDSESAEQSLGGGGFPWACHWQWDATGTGTGSVQVHSHPQGSSFSFTESLAPCLSSHATLARGNWHDLGLKGPWGGGH